MYIDEPSPKIERYCSINTSVHESVHDPYGDTSRSTAEARKPSQRKRCEGGETVVRGKACVKPGSGHKYFQLSYRNLYFVTENRHCRELLWLYSPVTALGCVEGPSHSCHGPARNCRSCGPMRVSTWSFVFKCPLFFRRSEVTAPG